MPFTTTLLLTSLIGAAAGWSRPLSVDLELGLSAAPTSASAQTATETRTIAKSSASASTATKFTSASKTGNTSSVASTVTSSSKSIASSKSSVASSTSSVAPSAGQPGASTDLSRISSKASASISSVSKASATFTSATTTATGCASASGDAPYSLSCDELASVITLPNGFQGKARGIVFLVHGTGSTGEETWGPGPYNTYLPSQGAGYDIAWFTSPTRSLGDAQVNAEYIAYNIKVLGQKSKTGKVFLIGHSQGNINIQWALEFWPSIRQYVSGFSSLAGDFHGTAEGPLLCTGQDLLQGGCEPSVLQQSVGSHYLAAQNAQGGSALVTTTSLYTLEDDIIQPEVVNPTSELPGATVISVQTACPGYVTDHFGMTIAAPAFFLTLDALEHGGTANLSRFNASSQCNFFDKTGQVNPFEEVPGVIRQAALDAISVVAYAPKMVSEPQLMSYVCEKGAASSYCSS